MRLIDFSNRDAILLGKYKLPGKYKSINETENERMCPFKMAIPHLGFHSRIKDEVYILIMGAD